MKFFSKFDSREENLFAKSHLIEKRKRNLLQNLEFREKNENFFFLKIISSLHLHLHLHLYLHLQIDGASSRSIQRNFLFRTFFKIHGHKTSPSL